LLPVQTFRTNNGADDTDRVGGENPAQTDAAANIPTVTTSTAVNNITLVFQGLTSGSGVNNTLLLDNVEVLQDGTALSTNPLVNPSFEDGMLSGTYQYNPSNGVTWTFNAQAGILANNSSFTPPNTTSGVRAGFVQSNGDDNGQISQVFTLSTAGTYTLRFQAANRNYGGQQAVRVTINGITVLANLQATGSYATYQTAAFTVGGGGSTALSSLATQSVAPVTVAANTTTAGVDFGFSFSTVVNANDTGQGSLRQFLTNANALGTRSRLAQAGSRQRVYGTSSAPTVALPTGQETSIFMIPDGQAHAGLRSGLTSGLTGSANSGNNQWALIALSSNLPTLTAANTILDGTTQTVNVSDSNPGQVGLGGPGSSYATVGTGGLTFNQFSRPEVEVYALTTTGSPSVVLAAGADSLTIRGFALHGGGSTVTANGITGFVLENNLIGTTAYVLGDPQLVTTNSAATYGVYLSGATLQATLQRNVVGYSSNSGVYLPSGATATGSDVLLAGNELVQNGYRIIGGDNITVGDQGSTGPVRIVGNLVRTANSDGLQFDIGQVAVGGTASADGRSRNVVRNNTFFDNGNGGVSIARAQLEGSAILYLQRTGSRAGTNPDSIYFNIINQTQAGAIVIGYGQSGVIISRNATFFNGTPFNSPTGGNLGIDLITRPSYYVNSSDAVGARDYGNGDGVTPNAGTVTSAFGNAGMNYPVFTLATATGTTSATVNVAGYVGSSALGQSTFSGAKVEIYTADNVPANNKGSTVSGDGRRTPHGEGRTYLGTLSCDGSGLFSGQLTVLANLPPLTGTAITGSLTATAYLPAYGTSEFGPNQPIIVAADVLAVITGNGPVNAGAQGTFTVTFSNQALTGPVQADGVVATVQLPVGLSDVTFPNGTAGSYNATTGLVTYSAYSTATPGSLANGATFSSTIGYTQPVAAPVTATATISTSTSEGGQTANNTATTTNQTNLLYDVTTTISGPATATAGNQVAYVVTTTNLGSASLPSPAPNVGQTVSVPAGATNVFVTGNGVITGSVGAGYTVTFPNLPALSAGQSVSQTVSFTAPSANYSVGATVTAPNDNDTTTNTASAATAVSASAGDLANVFVTIAPASANVAPGGSGSFTVTQGNNGPNPATGVQTTVLLPPGLTGVTVSNNSATLSNAYDSSTGLVTLPTVASQAPGVASNQRYTIGFTVPATGGVVPATAAVLTSSPDNIPADNTATSLITVPASADVVAQLVGPSTVLAGQSLTYTLTTSNNGPGLATAIGQTLDLPAGLPIGSVSPLLLNGSAPTTVSGTVASYGTGAAAITYDAATGRLTLPTVASLAPGANTTSLTVSYLAPANGNVNLSATAAVTAASPDSNPTNNSVGVTTTLLPATDVQVILTGASQTQPGSLITYGVTTYNNGPSTAPSVATTVSLPTGLTTVLLNGQAATSVSNGVYTYFDGTTYDSNNSSVSPTTSGLVTFPTLTGMAAGSASAAVNTISFGLPSGYQGTLTTTATTTVGGITDFFPSNNTSMVQPSIISAGSTSNDLQVALEAVTGSTIAAGSPINLALTVTSPSIGSSLLLFVQLVPGLTSGTGTVVVSVGGTAINASYDNVSGLLTLPAVQNTTAGQVLSYAIAISQAPGSGPLVALASATGTEADANLNNNLATQRLTITPSATLATTVSGATQVPAGATVSYLVTSTETGLSAATNPMQTVTIPAGATGLLVNGVATTVPSDGVLTLTLPPLLQPGSANTVTNTLSFTAPGAAGSSFTVAGNLLATGPGTVAAATATQPTTIASPAPIAHNVVNTLQAPEGTTAAAPLPIAPFSAVAQGTAALASYTVLSLPTTAQGMLYLWNGSSNALVQANQVLSLTDSNNLRFQPARDYVGNATFSYLATDNMGAISNAALYLVPVGSDTNSFYTTTAAKPAYQNNDVLAYVMDPNGALYSSSGQLYDPATGQLVNSGTGVSNGLATTSANAVLAATGPSQNVNNILPAGVSLNSTTGQFFVADYTKLPVTSSSTTYYFNVVTTDLYGGTNTVLAQFTFSANPLPVTLVQFDVQAQGHDAKLSWLTASEQNNDHFTLERSLDGTSFVAIGRLAGQGSKTTATTYAYTDLNAAAQTTGLLYYRLQQVDLDGTSRYSPVRAVRFTAADLSLYPNPAGAKAQLDLNSLSSGTYTFVVTNLLGQVVREAALQGGILHILDLSDLAAGTYQVRLSGTSSTGSAVNFTQRLSKL